MMIEAPVVTGAFFMELPGKGVYIVNAVMKYMLLLLTVLITISTNAQTKRRYTDTIIDGKLYHNVDDPPFKGCYYPVGQMPEAQYDLQRYFKNNLRYPKEAKRKKIQGRVVVQFVVNEYGSISGCKIARGIGGGCDEEALRVVQKMPRWKPGKENGKPTKVSYVLPIRFTLE